MANRQFRTKVKRQKSFKPAYGITQFSRPPLTGSAFSAAISIVVGVGSGISLPQFSQRQRDLVHKKASTHMSVQEREYNARVYYERAYVRRVRVYIQRGFSSKVRGLWNW